MKNKFDIYEFDIVNDVLDECHRLLDLANKTKICKEIEEIFENEISDSDDAPFVYIALATFFLTNHLDVPTTLSKKVVSYLSSSSNFSQRFEEDPNVHSAFLVWRKTFLKDLKTVPQNGREVKEKKTNNSLYIRTWNPFDVFSCELDIPNLSKKRLFLIVWDNIDWCKRKTPIVYFAIESNSPQTDAAEVWKNLVFLPASKIYPLPDFRYLLLEEKNLPQDTPQIVYLGNYPDITFPESEYIPENPNYYGMVPLSDLRRVVELGIRLLL